MNLMVTITWTVIKILASFHLCMSIILSEANKKFCGLVKHFHKFYLSPSFWIKTWLAVLTDQPLSFLEWYFCSLMRFFNDWSKFYKLGIIYAIPTFSGVFSYEDSLMRLVWIWYLLMLKIFPVYISYLSLERSSRSAQGEFLPVLKLTYPSDAARIWRRDMWAPIGDDFSGEF